LIDSPEVGPFYHGSSTYYPQILQKTLFLITKVLSISVTSDGYGFNGIRFKLLETNTKFKDLFSTMFAVQLLRDRYSKNICLFIQLYGLKITHTKQRGSQIILHLALNLKLLSVYQYEKSKIRDRAPISKDRRREEGKRKTGNRESVKWTLYPFQP